jgi:drug/metabolite transporter (DMT)-like permease
MRLVIALGIVYVVWGSTYFAIAVANRTLPPMLMLSVRFLVAGGLLYLWAMRRGETAGGHPGRRQWGAAAVIGGLLLVIDTGGVAWAEQRVASGLAALLVASVPLFMAILDRAFFGARLSLGAAAGIATGLLGIAILAGPSGRVDTIGAIVLLVASFSWAAGSTYARVAPLPRSPLLAAAMQMLCAGVGLAVVGIAMGELGRVHPSAVSGASLAAVAFLIVFGSLIAFTAYGWLLKNASTPLLSTYAYVNPGVAMFLGWAFAGEHVGGRELAAGLVILSSIALLALSRDARRAPVPVAQEAEVIEFPRQRVVPELAA